MANRARRRSRAGSSRRARKPSPVAALARVHDLALDMEEPLRHAICFVRAVEQADGRQGDEIEALAFVATEARMRLEAVQDIWRRLCDPSGAD